MAQKQIYRPPINGFEPHAEFRFLVKIADQSVGAFVDCKMPSISWKTQEVKEGGLNTHTHQLIGYRKKAKLKLKRGVAVTSVLTDWIRDTLQNRVRRQQVDIILLDIKHRPVMTWSIKDAYPIKWRGPKLKTKGKAIAIETLTLACGMIDIYEPEQTQG